jgi:hypothetical protein
MPNEAYGALLRGLSSKTLAACRESHELFGVSYSVAYDEEASEKHKDLLRELLTIRPSGNYSKVELRAAVADLSATHAGALHGPGTVVEVDRWVRKQAQEIMMMLSTIKRKRVQMKNGNWPPPYRSEGLSNSVTLAGMDVSSKSVLCHGRTAPWLKELTDVMDASSPAAKPVARSPSSGPLEDSQNKSDGGAQGSQPARLRRSRFVASFEDEQDEVLAVSSEEEPAPAVDLEALRRLFHVGPATTAAAAAASSHSGTRRAVSEYLDPRLLRGFRLFADGEQEVSDTLEAGRLLCKT